MGDEALTITKSATVPDGVNCNVYDRQYTTDTENLSQIGMVVVYKKAGVECARRKIILHDGLITAAMKRVYEEARAPVYQAAYDPAYQAAYDAAIGEDKSAEEAEQLGEAAGRTAGNQAVIDAGIVPGDPQAAWSAAQAKVAANDSPNAMVKLLASKDWGKLILETSWANEPI